MSILEEQKGNPFFQWALHYAGSHSYVYLPDISVIPALMKKWNLKAEDFILPSKREKDSYSAVYRELVQAIVNYWSNPKYDYDATTKTATIGTIKFKVTGTYRMVDHIVWNAIFVKGWVCSPEMTTTLLRIIRKDGGNKENPFNSVVRKGSSIGPTYLPDITYVPRLVKELGVQSPEELNILETGDWKSLWKGVTMEGFETLGGSLRIMFRYNGVTESVPLLWRESFNQSGIYYFSEFPKIVMERLKATIAHNKGSMPSGWTKDTFQAMTKNLQGKDLVSLCLSDTNFGKLCQANDQVLFRRKLMEEFGVNWDENDHGFESPMLLYKQMHVYYMYVRIKIPAEDFGGRNTYTVDKIGKSYLTAPLPISERLVTLVPLPEEKPKSEGESYIIFFPTIPKLSFYVNGYNVFDNGFLINRVRETNGIKQYLDDEEIKIFAEPLLNLHMNRVESNLLRIPEYEEADVNWYEEISGDRDIRIYSV